MNVNSVSSPKKNEAVATVAASIPTELDKFRARDKLLSLLTSKLDGDSGRTGPNDLDREEDWMPMKP